MAGFFVGIVTSGVVAADEGPAGVISVVSVAAVKQVAVEEDGVPGFALAVDQLHSLQSGVDALQIGARLIPRLAVIDPPHQVRAAKDLQATVGLVRPTDGDEGAGEERKEAAIR